MLLAIFQTEWAKSYLQEKMLEMAKKEGYTLQIGKIEGELPFKWTLSDVSLKFNKTDILELDSVRLRFSVLSLLKKQVALSYFYVENAELTFQKKAKKLEELPPFPWAFSVKKAKIKHLNLKEITTGLQMSYTLEGKAFFKKRGKSFALEASASSSELLLTTHIEGNKKKNSLSGFLKASLRSKEALSPIYIFPDNLSLTIDTTFEGGWKNNLPLKLLIKTDVQKFRDFSGTCEAWLSYFPSHALDIHHISLKSDLLCLKGEGSLDKNFHPKHFNGSFLLPHLSLISPQLAGILTGEMAYKAGTISCSFESQELKISSAIYENSKGNLKAHFKDNTWEGLFKLEASHEIVPIEFESKFSFSQEDFLKVQDLSLKVATAKLAGDTTLLFNEKTAEGAFFIQAQDLSPFATFFPDSYLKGSFASMISLNGKDTSFYALAQNLQCYDIFSSQINLKGSVLDFLDSPQTEISLTGETLYLKQFFFDRFNLSVNRSAFDFSCLGEWNNPFNLHSSGSFDILKSGFNLNFDTLKGSILEKTFTLQKPFSFHLTDKDLDLSEFDLKFKEGTFLASLKLDATSSKIRVQAEHFPIDLLALATQRFTLQGTSSLDIALDGSLEGLQGRANIFLEKAEILQSGKKIPIQSKGALQLNLDQNMMQIHGNFKASGEQFCEIALSAPTVYNFYPFRLGIDLKKPLFAELTMEGHLEEIFDFINIGSHGATGLLSSHLLLSNTLSDPRIQGTFELQNGSYENYFTGTILKEIYADGKALKDSLIINSIKATDPNQGTLSGKGALTFKEKYPFSFDFNIDNLQALHLNWLNGFFSGNVTISGNTEKALAQGELLIEKAQIEIPDELPKELPILPFQYINKPPHVSKMDAIHQEAYPLHYDLILHAKKNILLTGRGLNAELQGNLILKGKDLSIEGEGSLDLIKGSFSFSGKDFTLNQGSLSFINSPSPQAYLNLSGTLTLPTLTVTALLRGPLTSPILTLQSTPAMPTSSILSMILFNKDVSELSAIQAAQLAYSIVSLSGNSGPNVFEMIRKSLGIDKLNISAPKGDSDQFTVQIGKYLTKGVMITLSQGTATSHVIVEVELKNGFMLQAETQENEQAKFSLKWNKNY